MYCLTHVCLIHKKKIGSESIVLESKYVSFLFTKNNYSSLKKYIYTVFNIYLCLLRGCALRQPIEQPCSSSSRLPLTWLSIQ